MICIHFRTQFSTRELFIVALKTRYKTLYDLRGATVAYYTLQIMLLELVTVPELQIFIVVKYNELNAIKYPAETITIVDFHRYSTAILDYIKSINADSPGLIFSAVNNTASNKNAQSRRQQGN